MAGRWWWLITLAITHPPNASSAKRRVSSSSAPSLHPNHYPTHPPLPYPTPTLPRPTPPPDTTPRMALDFDDPNSGSHDNQGDDLSPTSQSSLRPPPSLPHVEVLSQPSRWRAVVLQRPQPAATENGTGVKRSWEDSALTDERISKQLRRTPTLARWAAVPTVSPLAAHWGPAKPAIELPVQMVYPPAEQSPVQSFGAEPSTNQSSASQPSRSQSPSILSSGTQSFDSQSPAIQPSAPVIQLSTRSSSRCCENGDCDDCILKLFEEYDPFEDIPEIEEARRTTKRLYGDYHIPEQRPIPPPPSVAPRKVKKTEKPIPFIGPIPSPTSLSDRPLPYVPLRDLERLLAPDDLKPEIPGAIPGQIVHVSFTPLECETILSKCAIATPKLQSVYHEIQYAIVHRGNFKKKPHGREKVAVTQFLTDCYKDPDGLYRHRKISSLRYNPSPTPKSVQLRKGKSGLLFASQLGGSRSREYRRQYQAQLFDTFHPYRVFNIASSAVINAIFHPTDPGQFAVSSLTNTDGYSRPNNLLLGNMDALPEPTIRSLDGHKTRPSASATQDYIWSTVTDISFSCDGTLLYSGSYDKTVKIWDATTSSKRGSLLQSTPVSSQVYNISADTSTLSLAAGLKNGNITIITNLTSSHPTTSTIRPPLRPIKTPNPLSVTTVLHFPTYSRPWLLAGYEDLLPPDSTLRQSGDLAIYDLRTLKPAFKLTPSVARIFDLCLSSAGQTFSTASSATSQRSKHIQSHLRLYDPRQTSSSSTVRADLEFDSPQKDINTLTVHGLYHTSSGTDNTTLVFDMRDTSHPVHRLTHGDTVAVLPEAADIEDLDSGVHFAQWVVDGCDDRFVTGGSDGTVRMWDVRRPEGEALVREVWKGETQVVSGAVKGEWMVVGEESGRVSVLRLGREEGEGERLFVNEGGGVRREVREEEEEEESGRRIARELVRSGRFVVEDGVAWEV
ncbi:WD40 repeat-like protein [Ascodesmis nigricans]|uniref:WD40 repeat-like protein n=1 Tax=Ascodesmis nigricans TaxID=341454 RepID=A0A4S2ML38_9PEZI|nr:WD40 repeat-like protein [Ascodesmis nigricans]